jgi:hypothetical protein
MRVPFELLVEQVTALSGTDRELPVGVLAGRLGTTAERLADAVTAARMLRGERTCLPLKDDS